MTDYNTNNYHKYFFDAQVKGGYTTTHYKGLVNLLRLGGQHAVQADCAIGHDLLPV